MPHLHLTRPALAATLALLAAGAQAQTTIKIGYTPAQGSHYSVGATTFCAEVEKNTQNRYKCQQFPSSALGGEREMVESVQLGTQDAVITSTGPVGNFVPEIKVVDIPFLFRDYDHARKVFDGPIGQDLLTKFPSKNLIALAWTENGFRHITNSKRPIMKPEDTKGLKVRTMENKVHMDGYRTFGMMPTPMSFPEVFGALQQGTVDGQENPIPIITTAKFSQVQKYLSLTGHVYSPALLMVSNRLWDKVSAADRKVFQDAARLSVVAQRKKVDEDDATGVALLEKEGMQVVRNVDKAAFQEALKPAYVAYAKEFGADRIKQIQDVR
ncbi:TRAP transporter substrate-binding protein [Pseudorhodoferax sp. Leaf267]|uniref:TRAP transporter substrate-binding protein n=1 Tax=Pseudorhodoferax sp. Leaf267 TaxID=1736316 RepID=UPI0006F760C9|nr:TRAP transporter substrate-binding protein [Pseudorhodoferax sp. Leaf267]KQP23022.1 C4-dicarboxylate ABC transporter substrate-binding protein [Pseudorhodoferax sp. Leaf267]